MKKTNFIQTLINFFGRNKVITDLKSIKGKDRIRQTRDENDNKIWVKRFDKPKLIGSSFRDGKYLYRVITGTDENGEQLMERKIVR